MKGVIRLGDPTKHGGQVIGQERAAKVQGRSIALRGDKVSCPIPGHHDCFIQTIHNPGKVMLDGVDVAMHNDLASCGCMLMSTAPDSGQT
jgi:uncharacterized Zn-binding protein involved in type VI secretion